MPGSPCSSRDALLDTWGCTVTCAIIRCGNGLSHVLGQGLGSLEWTQHPDQSSPASLQLPLELFASCFPVHI